MPYKVPLPNAFTLNTTGLHGEMVPFPFYIFFHQWGQGEQLSIGPLRVVDICDLLERFGLIVVFGVSTLEYEHGSGRVLQLDEVAGREGAARATIDADTIVISPRALAGVLSGMHHYNLRALDQAPEYTEYDVIADVLAADDRRERGPILPLPSGAHFYLDSHDDCFLVIESFDLSLLKAVFTRALLMHVGTVIAEGAGSFGNEGAGDVPDLSRPEQVEGGVNGCTRASDFTNAVLITNDDADTNMDEAEVTIIVPPSRFVDNVWPRVSTLTVLRSETSVNSSKVRVGVSTEEFEWGKDKEYPTAFVIEYDYEKGEWSMTP